MGNGWRVLYDWPMISWIGTLASIAGSFIVAVKLFLLGYILFLIGSTCWLYIAAKRRDKSLALLNGTFLIANLVGLYGAI